MKKIRKYYVEIKEKHEIKKGLQMKSTSQNDDYRCEVNNKSRNEDKR